MRHTVAVLHNFETAHRLPHLGGKCQSLHGHSWWAEATVAADELTGDGTVVEFGPLKAKLREWVDHNLDHGVMLGAADPLVAPLVDAGCKVYRFGADDPTDAEALAADLPWPTVENVAHLLARVAEQARFLVAPEGQVTRVLVRETHVNRAEWRAQ